MIINLVLFFIPKRQEIYRLYLIKKRKKLACMRLNSNLTYHNITLQNKDLQEYALSLTDSVEIVSFDKTTTNAPCDYGWAIIFRKYQDSKIIAFSKIENNIYSCTKGALYDGWGSWRLI